MDRNPEDPTSRKLTGRDVLHDGDEAARERLAISADLGIDRKRGRRAPLAWAAWSASAALGAYFCMYAFRKPFTAATYSGGMVWGVGEKTALVTAQVLGYALSKLIGIRVVAQITPARRAAAILMLIAMAE